MHPPPRSGPLSSHFQAGHVWCFWFSQRVPSCTQPPQLPPPQSIGGTQWVGQTCWLPHPSETVPHWSAVHVDASQGPLPHWLGPAAPHVVAASHVPHDEIRLPQPSGIALPQLAPRSAHVCAV